MTKRKNKNTNLLTLLVVLLGLVSIFTIFLPAFQYGSDSFTGVQTSFGYSETTGSVITVTTRILSVNWLSLIGFMLPILGVVVAVLAMKSKVFSFIGIATFIVAGICAFVSITTFPSTIIGSSWISLDWQLAYGIIISGVCSLVAGLLLLFKLIIK